MIAEDHSAFKETCYHSHMISRLVCLMILALVLTGCYGGVRSPFGFGSPVQRAAVTNEERASAAGEVFVMMPPELRINVLTVEDAARTADAFQLQYVTTTSRTDFIAAVRALSGWSVEEVAAQDHTTLVLRSSTWDITVLLSGAVQRPTVLITGVRVAPV